MQSAPGGSTSSGRGGSASAAAAAATEAVPAAALDAIVGGSLSRPMATYSPLGAADSGYQTDSPLLSLDAATRSATPAAETVAPVGRRQVVTPPPGTFRPVSPPPGLLDPHRRRHHYLQYLDIGSVSGGVRHVATQTSQHPAEGHRPFQPQHQVPLFHSQLSTGFRPASAPLYDLPDTGAIGGDGVIGNQDEAELEEDFDEEVYRSSAAVGGGGMASHPLPDLVQLRHQAETARQRSRSVPVTDDDGARQERVALLLREIGDQYNQSRASPAALAPWLIGGGPRVGAPRSRDRRISLRIDPTQEEEVNGSGSGDWRGSIVDWVTRMARTLSGADIALEEDEDQSADRSSGTGGH